MDQHRRFTILFVTVSSVVAAAVCVGIALGLIKLINWTFLNCGSSTACSAATWIVSFWWVLFVPTCVVVAVLLRRLHDSMRARVPEGN